ncbi:MULTISPECIES: hypothetical protein [unclassified Modestobacter]|uniref:hypothetical protein n=1 Tax=unclassified Modestobacter TaxID=2643866 RepID=UPI0022AA3D78|nr:MULTISPECIES: hypothetical protein [unclassified Modestobacter]MCZ2822884.1 hypothetical protein [Modestobacter sp. VKM Ac-2981]MCZ2851130.1 hypothetical protein [Modestobacter sp. VKM Ac-2982]
MRAAVQPSTDETVLAPPHRKHVLVALGLSALFLALQVVLTDHGDMGAGAAGWFWMVVGCLLLATVYRGHSRVARGVVVVSAFVGVIVYGLAALTDPRAALVALAFLGQALPLLTKPVRQHVRHHD